MKNITPSQENEHMRAVYLTISGDVQGVGMRFHVQQIAIILNITGKVKNMPSGKVEVEAEGKLSDIQQFIDFCKLGPDRAVVAVVDIEEVPYTGSFSTFSISY